MGARELLADLCSAGFHITAQADRLVIRPWSKLPDDMRKALRNAKPELLALLAGSLNEPAERIDLAAVAWTATNMAAYLDRRARLLRWGWSDADAESLAERLVKADRDDDERVSCADCRHYRPGHCGDHRRAGLTVPDVGRDLVVLLQRCPGFKP